MSRREPRAAVLLHWVPALGVMAAIWGVSSVQVSPDVIDAVPFKDKGAHFLAYALLGAAVAHAAKRTWPDQTRLRTALLAVWITVGWGVLDELHQAFVPGRMADVSDLVADGLGAALGASMRYVMAPLARRISPEESHS